MSERTYRHKLIGLFILALVCLALGEDEPAGVRRTAPSADPSLRAQALPQAAHAVLALLSTKERSVPVGPDTGAR